MSRLLCALCMASLASCSLQEDPVEQRWIVSSTDSSEWGPTDTVAPPPLPILRDLQLSVLGVPQPGQPMTLHIDNANPNQLVAVVFSEDGPGPGTLCPAALNHHCVSITNTMRTMAVRADAAGEANIVIPVPSTVVPGDRWWFQAGAAREVPFLLPKLSDVVLVEDFDLDGDGIADSDIPMESGLFGDGVDNCSNVDVTVNSYPNTIQHFLDQDALAAHRDDAVLYIGSSSIRRSQTLHTAISDYHSIQRGLGGARITEFVNRAVDWVATYDPQAIVMYAGANDFSAGQTPAEIVDDYRCFIERIRQTLGQDVPIFYIGLTPNPARWADWPLMDATNASIAALAADNGTLHYIDVATPFLQTGSPPSSVLFDGDLLHLNAVGYALWDAQIRSSLNAVLPPAPTFSPSTTLGVGDRVLIDIGPTNVEDGALTASPDSNGLHWNNWHALEGDAAILAGERLPNLVTSAGTATDIQLTVSGGFLNNGILNGGLTNPDAMLLGDLAQGTATQDYFYVGSLDAPGALLLDGLEPGRSYQLRFFASRNTGETRTTRYNLQGGTSASVTLTTSNPTNTSNIAAASVEADSLGRIHVDVKIEAGSFAYLSLLELQAL